MASSWRIEGRGWRGALTEESAGGGLEEGQILLQRLVTSLLLLDVISNYSLSRGDGDCLLLTYYVQSWDDVEWGPCLGEFR